MSNPVERVIDVTRAGDWLPLQELYAVALAAAGAEGPVVFDVKGVDYLDAGVLQIVLALIAERKRSGVAFRLEGPSLLLSQWFEYAGGI